MRSQRVSTRQPLPSRCCRSARTLPRRGDPPQQGEQRTQRKDQRLQASTEHEQQHTRRPEGHRQPAQRTGHLGRLRPGDPAQQ